MKKYLLHFFFFCIAINGMSQSESSTHKVVSIVSEQQFYLNGGGRAMLGGRSRVSIPIQLPAKTVAWYYSITTQEGEHKSANQSIQLVTQLGTLLGMGPVAGITASMILTPTGARVCDVYLLDQLNNNAFLNKVDNNGGSYTYYSFGSRQNFREGTVQINNPINQIVYLGLKNPSASTGLTVFIEVAAIVATTEQGSWSDYEKENLSAKLLTELKEQLNDEQIAREASKCLSQKIIETKKPLEYYLMFGKTKKNFHQELLSVCMQGYQQPVSQETQKAATFGTLGWKKYEAGDVEKCIEYSKKALELSNNLGWVKANLGLCYMIKGDESTATNYYVDALEDIKLLKLKAEASHYLKAIIDDIETAMKKNENLKGAEEIRSLYAMELKKY